MLSFAAGYLKLSIIIILACMSMLCYLLSCILIHTSCCDHFIFVIEVAQTLDSKESAPSLTSTTASWSSLPPPQALPPSIDQSIGISPPPYQPSTDTTPSSSEPDTRPPTTGFVPSHGVVSANPQKVYFQIHQSINVFLLNRSQNTVKNKVGYYQKLLVLTRRKPGKTG